MLKYFLRYQITVYAISVGSQTKAKRQRDPVAVFIGYLCIFFNYKTYKPKLQNIKLTMKSS